MVSSLEIIRRRMQALLDKSGYTRKDLALYLGKQPSWSTEFFNGHHGVTLKDLDRVARFFGVSVPQLFELDGYRFRDRRRGQRRGGVQDRRVRPGRLHGERCRNICCGGYSFGPGDHERRVTDRHPVG